MLLEEWDLQLFAQDDEGDKTEDPTPHRKREARRKGQVFKSMEFNSALNVLGVMFLFMVLGERVFEAFSRLLENYLGNIAAYPLTLGNMRYVSIEAFEFFFMLVGPVFAVAFLVGIASNLAQVGFLFTGENIKPQLKKLNPLEGVKKILSRKALFELFKALSKIGIIGTVTYFFLRENLDRLLVLMAQEVQLSATVLWDMIVTLGLIVGLVFILLSILDYIYQRYEHLQQLKMSKREIKEEHKHLEGDPQVKSKLKEKQRYIARQRMLQEVPEADVVITNPTEIAVALRYREGEDQAPVLLAKGVEVLAQRIREIAEDYEVPMVENPPIARGIWESTELGEEIPVEMYQAVAEILAMVYRMQEQAENQQR